MYRAQRRHALTPMGLLLRGAGSVLTGLVVTGVGLAVHAAHPADGTWLFPAAGLLFLLRGLWSFARAAGLRGLRRARPVGLPARWIVGGSIPSGRPVHTEVLGGGATFVAGAGVAKDLPYPKLVLQIDVGRMTLTLRPGLRTLLDRLFQSPPPFSATPSATLTIRPVNPLGLLADCVLVLDGQDLLATIQVNERTAALAAFSQAGFTVLPETEMPMVPGIASGLLG